MGVSRSKLQTDIEYHHDTHESDGHAVAPRTDHKNEVSSITLPSKTASLI